MIDEKIILPDFLIADLYKECLVDVVIFATEQAKMPEEKQPAQPAEIPGTEKLAYLGENGKKVTVVVNQPGVKYLNEPDLTFLTNILKACQLSLADIAIINIATQPVTYTVIKEQLNALYILLFQTEPTEIKLPFTVPSFQVQKYDGCTIMKSPALSELNKTTQDGRVLKTKLWVSLKQVFGID